MNSLHFLSISSRRYLKKLDVGNERVNYQPAGRPVVQFRSQQFLKNRVTQTLLP